MASIKDVASKANVSISTVSIIINGKAKERKISKETQDKVLQAMKDVHYQPNLSAKKLRSLDSKKTIALFWTTDFREMMLSRFLSGLQNQIKKTNEHYDIIIYPYENNQLNQEESLTKIANFHGAIIANASEKDIDFLKQLKPMVPIVLYNRQIDGYSHISVDDRMIAQKIFEVIQNHKHVGIIKAPYAFDGMVLREQELKRLLDQNHQSIAEYCVHTNSVQGGYDISKDIDFLSNDVLVCASDMIGTGIIHYCYEENISIPHDIEIIAIGNGLTHIDEFLNPSLSIVEVPMEKMAEECIHALSQLFQQSSIIHKTIEPEVKLRHSIKDHHI